MDILNDFLLLSKFEEGRIEYNLEFVIIELKIIEIIGEMKEYGFGVYEIIYKYIGGSEVEFDIKLLKNIFFNLILNVIKFFGENELIVIILIVLEKEL